MPISDATPVAMVSSTAMWALRKAVESLWNDPARAHEMGRNARAYVEKYHTLEKFTSTTRSAAEAFLNGRPAPDTWWE